MKYILVIICLPAIGLAQIKTGKELIEKVHAKFYHKSCKTIAFKQETIRHQKTEVASSPTIWTEYIEFPDRLRIEMGDSINGNFTIYKNDSAYHYRKHKLARSESDSNLIMLLLGGMYCREIDNVLARLKSKSIDLSKISTQELGKKKYYVVGVSVPDSTKPQIWFDKSTMMLFSYTEKSGDDLIKVMVNDRQKACEGEIETNLSIYVNGQLIQEEKYFDIKLNQKTPEGKFELN